MPILKFPKLLLMKKLENQIWSFLPNIKEKDDNYIHTYMYVTIDINYINIITHMLHVCTQYFTCIYMIIMV